MTPATARTRRRHAPGASPTRAPGRGVAYRNVNYAILGEGRAGIASRVGVGIGWKRGDRDGTPFWNHEGGGPGFTSETRVYPDQRVAVVVLMNATQSAKLSWVADALCEVVRG